MVLIKYLQLVGQMVSAIWILWFIFPRVDRDTQLNEIQVWAKKTLHVMGLRVHYEEASSTAQLSTMPLILVANHVSWLDVLIIQSLQPSIFIAKSEVRQWPLVGAMAQASGVVFVDRESTRSTLKMVESVSLALRQGYCVAGFPEGTSSEGREVSLFHANLFEAAVHHQIQVQPLALRYSGPITGELCSRAAFVGDMGFLSSLHQVMTAPCIQAGVFRGEMLSPLGHSRRSLANLSHRCVRTQLAALAA
jgi:1-acyl-sn-glycerol-3-phosphate acyltransferase